MTNLTDVLYPGSGVPPEPVTGNNNWRELVTVDRWNQQWTNPPAHLAKPGLATASQQFATFIEPVIGSNDFKEIRSEDRWHQEWPRVPPPKPAIPAGEQQYATYTPPVLDQFWATRHWFRPS